MPIARHDRALLAPLLLLVPAVVPASGGDMTEERVLIDFAAAADREWFAVDDGVMGGVSSSSMHRTDRGTGLFAGVLSLENNGGFASVRTLLDGVDVTGAEGLELRVRGDGRTYQLRLRTDERFDGVAYAASFATAVGEWIRVRLPLTDFRPTFRGRVVPGAPALDPAALRQLTFMIADKQAGAFALEIATVRTWSAGSDR